MVTIFWDKDGILLIDYLAHGSTTDSQYYESLIDLLRRAVLEKRRRKISHGALLFYENAPIHKSNIVQAVIHQAGFVELNHPAYSPDIAPTNYYLFLNLKKNSP